MTTEPQTRILSSGTMRTGGSLLSNLMCAQSETFVFGERFHFFRFCFNRYLPLTEKSVRRMLEHQALRLKYRFEIDFDPDDVFERVKARGLTHAVIYDEGMKYFLRKVKRRNWGEYCAMQWQSFPAFLNMFDNACAIQIYRDPRSVVSSWKKLSFAPGNQYLNTIFNWIHSVDSAERYMDELPNDRYLLIRYEDLMENPEVHTKRICEVTGITFEEEMLQPETWHARLPSGLLINPRSAHEGENIRGFSMSRTKNWVKNLEDWEIALIEYLCGDRMRRHGYESHKDAYSLADIERGLAAMGGDPLLMQRLEHLLATGEGTPLYYNDPTDPRNWAAARKDISARFTDAESDDAINYFAELEQIEERLEKAFGPD